MSEGQGEEGRLRGEWQVNKGLTDDEIEMQMRKMDGQEAARVVYKR